MAWFQLDPNSIAQRATAADLEPRRSGLGPALARGSIGFCAVSVAGFVPWAFFGRELTKALGEAGLYAVCAVVFIALAGALLHPLILGRGSFGRFYRLFGIAFAAYSAAWIGGWMALRGHAGSLVGLLAGAWLMGGILARAFDAKRAALPVILVLFLANSAGYFLGGWTESELMKPKPMNVLGYVVPRGTQVRVAMLSWGVFYGLGLGAGLGFAFHRCQRGARELMAARFRAASTEGDRAAVG